MATNHKLDRDGTVQPFPFAANNDIASWTGFLLEWNSEITRFYLRRYQKLAMLPLRLHGCRTQEDIRALQTELSQELIEDYRFEATKLSQIAFGARLHSDNQAENAYAASLSKAQRDAAAIINLAKDQAERIRASAIEEARGTQKPDGKDARLSA